MGVKSPSFNNLTSTSNPVNSVNSLFKELLSYNGAARILFEFHQDLFVIDRDPIIKR